MPANPEFSASFEFPEFLTVRQDAAYQRAVNDCIDTAKAAGHAIEGGVAYAVIVAAAFESGLLRGWSCPSMPRKPESVDEVDIAVVYWLGPLVHEWVEQQRHVPKVGFLRRLIWRLTKKLTRRPNSP